jgi:hypothetical protein
VPAGFVTALVLALSAYLQRRPSWCPHTPAGPDLLSALLLNHVTLRPGEAMYLGAGVLPTDTSQILSCPQGRAVLTDTTGRDVTLAPDSPAISPPTATPSPWPGTPWRRPYSESASRFDGHLGA